MIEREEFGGGIEYGRRNGDGEIKYKTIYI